MSQEDLVVNQMIPYFEEKAPSGCEFHPEVGYNDYGDKGVVDLVVESWATVHDIYEEKAGRWLASKRLQKHKGDVEVLTVIEVKSEYAVNESTGANELIRQFKRHQDHFFAGSDYNHADWHAVEFYLIFAETQETQRHVAQNWRMYASTDGIVQMWDIEQGRPGAIVRNVGHRSDLTKPHWAHVCESQDRDGPGLGPKCGDQAKWLRKGKEPLCDEHAEDYDPDELDAIASGNNDLALTGNEQ